MTYIKFTTALQTSENTSFNLPPDILLQSTLDTGDAAGWEGAISRLVDSRTVLAPLSGDGPDALLTGERVRHISVTCLPESPVAVVITFDSVSICTIPGGMTMNFVALPAQEDQDKYGFFSNSTTEQAIARIITSSFATF
jgi:hypothetical protein